jgi:hypothetical protein
MLLVDLLYVVLVLRMLKNEGKDACGALLVSCEEFKDYWEFWNFVDCTSILVGLLVIFILVVNLVFLQRED